MTFYLSLRLALAFFVTTLFAVRSLVDSESAHGLWMPAALAGSSTLGVVFAIFLRSRSTRWQSLFAALLAPAFQLALRDPQLTHSTILLLGINFLMAMCVSCMMAGETATALHVSPGRFGMVRAAGSVGAIVAYAASSLIPDSYLLVSMVSLLLFLGQQRLPAGTEPTRFPDRSTLLRFGELCLAAGVIGVVAKPYEAFAAVSFANAWGGGEALVALGVVPELVVLLLWHRLTQQHRRWLWRMTPLAWSLIYGLFAISSLDGWRQLAILGLFLQWINCTFQATAAQSIAIRSRSFADQRQGQLLLIISFNLGGLVGAVLLSSGISATNMASALSDLWSSAAILTLLAIPVVFRTARRVG